MALTDDLTLTPSAVVARWQRAYATRLFVTDLVSIGLAVYGSQLLRFGLHEVELDTPGSTQADVDISYTLVSLALVVAWMVALEVYATRDHKIIGLSLIHI